LFAHDLRANAFRVCREGKPLYTFPDHALMETPALRPRGPTSTTVPLPLGEVLRLAGDAEASGRFEEARRLLDYILAAEPNEPSALHLSGVVAFRLGDPEKALAQMERSLELGIDTPLYLRNICEMYRVLGRLDEALDTARQAVVLAPSDPLCLQNIAIIHFHRLEIDEAIACADAALRIDPTLPGAHFARAEALLLRGDWEQGWEEYEWRFRIQGASPLMPPTNAPQWDGKPLQSETLLLVADQGFGDVVQFCRYIPWAVERCPDIAIACSKPMAALVRQQHPTLKIFQHWQDCPPFAAYCALSGLPRLHGTRTDNVPALAPYLHADPKRIAQWRERLDRIAPRGYRRVGLVWAGQPRHNNDRNRSTTLSTFAPLGSLRGIALVSLQKGPATVQAGQYFGQAPLLNIGAEVADYDDTMAIIDSLDLVITVDTSVGHLAGAMNRPSWIMLPRAPDWRWLLERSDSPWYPSVRLFRQSVSRQWAGPIGEITAALREQFAAV
jgi:Flp pilus assembly protein TadD